MGPASIVLPPGGGVPGGGRCTWTYYEWTGRNALGVVLGRYVQRIEWCYNGMWITSTTRLRWAEVYVPLWEFRGHIGNYESGGVGFSSYRAWTQGQFSLCIAQLGCLQHVYPWIDTTVFADGYSRTSWGGG